MLVMLVLQDLCKSVPLFDQCVTACHKIVGLLFVKGDIRNQYRRRVNKMQSMQYAPSASQICCAVC